MRKFSAWFPAVLLALLLAPEAVAQDRTSPWRNPIRRLVLDNGLVLLHHKDDSSAVTALEILIKGGKRAEPEGLAGIAYLCARLMLEMHDSQSTRTLMVQGSPMSLSSQGDFCLIEVEALSKHLEETLKILSRPLLRPLFSGIRIDALKKYMAHLRQRENEDATSLYRAMYLRAVFGPSGYGASPYGTDESVRAIKSRDLVQFHENQFRAENVILSVVSDREAEDVAALLQKSLKNIAPGRPAGPRPLSISDLPPKVLQAEKDTLQSLVAAAFPLPETRPRLFALASLAESLLGKGVGSRLWGLRQEERLAYNISCSYLLLKGAGVLEAFLETENEKLAVGRDAFRNVLEELSTRGVDAAELEAARQVALTEFLNDNESKNSRARNMAVYEALGLGHDFLEKIPSLYASVTVEEMNTFLAERLGPQKEIQVVITGTRKTAAAASR